MTAESFTEWLRSHEHDRSAIGDLARDVAADDDWPEDAGHYEQAGYLRSCDACDAALAAHRAAWEQYRKERQAPDVEDVSL